MSERYPLQCVVASLLLSTLSFTTAGATGQAPDRSVHSVRGAAALPTHGRSPVRHYTIEAVEFRCLDESGYDFAGSDEVMVILRHPGRRTMTISSIFGNVNSDETRTFGAQESCVLPLAGVQNDWRWAPNEQWACAVSGMPGPLSFNVEMYEADSDDWNDLWACVTNPGCPFSITPHGSYPESSRHWIRGDELIGKAQITLSTTDLQAGLHNVGDVVEESVILNPCEGICGEGWPWPTGPEYSFTYRITRLADRPLVDPILDPDP